MQIPLQTLRVFCILASIQEAELVQWQSELHTFSDLNTEFLWNSTGISDAHADPVSLISTANHISATEGHKLQPRRLVKPVIWVHLHNVAGTFVCHEAKKQGEKTGPRNCCINDMDRCSTPKHLRVPCVHRRALSNKYTFTMVEREVTGEDLDCEGVMYGIMLRNPLHGAISTLVNNGFDKSEIFQALQTGVPPPLKKHRCLPEEDTYQHFDNFAVRTLSGNYSVAPGAVTREHLDHAKAQLKKFHIVMILENLQQQRVQLKGNLGWDLQLMAHHGLNKHSSESLGDAFTPTEREFLKEHNALDFELYEFGKELAASRTEAATRASRRF